MSKITGVGSRQTPVAILLEMLKIGECLSKQGHLLRSGGADGADKAFEMGWNKGIGPKEIYLPY